MQHIALAIGYPGYIPEAAIVNYYPLGGSMGGHTDHYELDLSWPLVSISFGQTAVFLIGGKTRNVKPTGMEGVCATFSKGFWRVGYLLGWVGWVTPEYRKMLWGPLRGDGRRFQGGSLVSCRPPGFEKAVCEPQKVWFCLACSFLSFTSCHSYLPAIALNLVFSLLDWLCVLWLYTWEITFNPWEWVSWMKSNHKLLLTWNRGNVAALVVTDYCISVSKQCLKMFNLIWFD